MTSDGAKPKLLRSEHGCVQVSSALWELIYICPLLGTAQALLKAEN